MTQITGIFLKVRDQLECLIEASSSMSFKVMSMFCNCVQHVYLINWDYEFCGLIGISIVLCCVASPLSVLFLYFSFLAKLGFDIQEGFLG